MQMQMLEYFIHLYKHSHWYLFLTMQSCINAALRECGNVLSADKTEMIE